MHFVNIFSEFWAYHLRKINVLLTCIPKIYFYMSMMSGLPLKKDIVFVKVYSQNGFKLAKAMGFVNVYFNLLSMLVDRIRSYFRDIKTITAKIWLTEHALLQNSVVFSSLKNKKCVFWQLSMPLSKIREFFRGTI